MVSVDVDMTDEPVVIANDVVDSSAPMEVTVVSEPKPSGPQKGEYTWTIKNFSDLDQRENSPLFELGGYYWKLLVFPKGNQNARGQQLSLYLVAEAAPDSNGDILSFDRHADFKLILVDQENPAGSIVKDSKHNFHSAANDWGFTTFVGLDELHNPARHLKSADDTVIIKVEATVQAPIVEKPYDSKAETGFVGLKNQGATCYMNSLLQTLFNVNQFRRAVYHMPTDEDADPSASMPLALQSVFYKLQFGQTAVSTQDLTRSFGWDSADAFQQHDVQELNRILCDRLEEKMKGTRVEGMVNKLFEGQTLNYIDCINIDYKSSRREAFQDLQLDVKGCRDIYDSFDKYCEVETLEGDNKYEAEGHGKQDAKKGVLFDSLPPVLNLHLKRFEYDYTKDMMVKINDRHEFYEELDLDNGKEGAGAKYLSEDADRGVRNKYRLLAVLVHSGGVHGGHYYAYIRPDGKQWLKFDDEHVNKSDASEAIDNNWGSGGDDKASVTYGVAPVRIAPRFSNAYMLVYVRESEWDSVMCKVTEEDISEHVRARLKAEKEEKERLKREKAEAHLYTMVRIATDEDIKAQIGHTKSFDLVDMDAVGLTLKMKKSATFAEVQAEVTKRLNLPPEQQRYWQWAFRRNETFRPAKVLVVDSPDQTLQSLDERRQSQVYGRTPEMTKLDLFLETPTASSGAFIPLTNSSILLFFKRFIPDSSEQPACLEYAGRAILTKTNKVKDLPALCRKLAGLHPDTELSLAEEIKFEPDSFIEDMINPEVSLDKGEIEHGDIIVFQETAMEDGEFPKAADYFKFVRNRLSVTFKPLDGEEEGSPEFHLELLRNTTYEDVSAAVAQRLGLDDPLKVQFTQVNAFSHQPKPHPLRYVEASKMELFSMLPQKHNKLVEPVVYYQIIDLPLPEFERLVTYRIAFHNSKHDEVATVAVRIAKDRTVGELLEEVRQQLPAKHRPKGPLRLMEIYQWKIWQLFDPEVPIDKSLSMSTDLWHLRAEEVPEDQVDLAKEGQLHVHCLQVQDKDGNDKIAFPFSDPFVMSVAEGETVAHFKARVQAEMDIPAKEFTSWKVMLLSGLNLSMEPLAEDAVISQRLNRTDMGPTRLYGHADRQAIGFHHENKNPRRTHAHINRSAVYQERALKIRA